MLGCTFCTVHAKTAKLSNPKASKEARKLYKTLQSFHAQGKTLSGQMWAPWGIDEIEFVYKETGKYPAVRGWMLWHTSHVQRHNKAELRRIYNHPDVITLDELQSAK